MFLVKSAACLAGGLALFFCTAAAAIQPLEIDSVEAPPGQLPEGIEPVAYRLVLQIDPRSERFEGTTSIDIDIDEATDTIWLHGKNLDVRAATLTDPQGESVAVSYEEVLESGVAKIDLPVAVEGRYTLNFEYTAPFDKSGYGLYKATHKDGNYAATQLQATGARQVFPSFDEPRFKVPFEIVLRVPDGMAAFTTTPVAKSLAVDGWMQQTHETTRPLPTYLLAFAVGPYDVLAVNAIPPSDYRDVPVPLRGIAVQGQGPRLGYALEHTEELLELLEAYFAVPYPYTKLDLVAVPFHSVPGMENVGIIVYHDSLLLLSDDSPVVSRRFFMMAHAHELAHQWFGNLVTPYWWDDAWLNESFASWMAMRVSQQVWPEGNFDRWMIRWAHSAMEADSVASAQPIREEIKRNEDIENAFDSLTYLKGGGVLTMFELFLGNDTFREGVRYHIDRFTDGVATADDFFESLSTASANRQAASALRSFIDQPGVPMLDVTVRCEDDRPRLDVTQTRFSPLGSGIDPRGQLWQVPMCAKLFGGSEVSTHCQLLTARSETVDLPGGTCDLVVQPNANAAGYYRYTVDDATWQKLIARIPQMPPSDALAVGDSLGGAFRAGEIATDLYSDGIAALSGRAEWDLVFATTSQLETLLKIAKPEDVDRLRTRFRELLAPTLAAHGKGSDENARMFQSTIATFLIEDLHDPGLMASLADRAVAYIGAGTDRDPSVLEADERAAALAAGVRTKGSEFSAALLELARTTDDPELRGDAYAALVNLEDGAVLEDLLEMIEQGELDAADARTIIAGRFGNPETRESTFDWFSGKLPSVIDAIPTAFRGSFIGFLGRNFCSESDADRWHEFVLKNSDLLPGYELSLDNTLRDIRSCAALADARAEEVVDAFL